MRQVAAAGIGEEQHAMAIRLSRIFLFAALTASAVVGSKARAEPPARPDQRAESRARIQEKIADLDSPFYSVRSRTAAELEQWLGRTDLAPILSEQFEQLNFQADLPMEIRWRISLWRKRLPPARSEPPQTVSEDELARLVLQLDDDSYAAREGATERLLWMAGSERLAGPIMVGLRRRLAEPAISEDCYRRVESVCNVAWGAWVASDAPELNAPSPSDEQVRMWLDELTESSPGRGVNLELLRRAARRRMLYALTQDRDVPRLKAAMEARARGDKNAAALLDELIDLTRPAVVSESWSGGAQILEQRLVLGVPAQAQDGEHPIFFDRVNDETAHCESGAALPPGDYPVDIAFVPPNYDPQHPVIFYLIYLSTPRRQIAYSYFVKTDRAARLARLSRRTLDRYASQKRQLDGDQLATLDQLDAREVSRFAGRIFETMPDGPVAFDLDQDFAFVHRRRPGQFGSRDSCFGAICAQLLTTGTREAAPGLMAALRQKRFRPPLPSEPYWLPWMAAFAIARRDPWPDADAWLAENLDNPQTIVLDRGQAGRRLRRAAETPGTKGPATGDSEETATIGAMAAALLARRHACRPASLGLLRTSDKRMEVFNLYGYRYGKPEDIERVRQWWKAQSAAPRAAASRASK